MDHTYALCLIGAMDRLWYHQIILFPDPKTFKIPDYLVAHYAADQEISSTASTLRKEELSADSPAVTPLDGKEKRSVTGRARSCSSSPSAAKGVTNGRRSRLARRLRNSATCKSVGKLELEEVKGFMDLGFIFKEEHISPRMMRVVPGLQRLKLHKKWSSATAIETTEGEKEERTTWRPYLSEAWTIKRPDSPLLKLRVPRVSGADEMKKHLLFWAKTVASEVKHAS